MQNLPAEHDDPHVVPQDGGLDLTAAQQRLGNDDELLREMARIVVQDTPGLLEQVASGLNATDVEPACRAAHSLKGLTSNFSESAAAAALAVEQALHSGDADRIQKSVAVLAGWVERLNSELQRTVLQ